MTFRIAYHVCMFLAVALNPVGFARGWSDMVRVGKNGGVE